MDEDRLYLVPDYFPDFHCKMGACRKPCCEGWPISVTMTDYFRLLGCDCSPELRRKLDCCLRISLRPTPDAYAQISPGWDGFCPLHRVDGLCALHAELGDSVLAAVCRLYPRGARTGEHRECSCANSCEAVPEMFLTRKPPLHFISIPFSPGLPDAPARRNDFHTNGRDQEIRLWLISFLQNRSLPLPQRIIHMGAALHVMDDALSARDDARVAALLSDNTPVPVPDMPAPQADQLTDGLRIAARLLEIIDDRSDSVRSYGMHALDMFTQHGFSHYVQSAQAFSAIIPQWETWFEHMLVNHLFFTQFPFQDRPIPLRTEYLSFCAVYMLLRFLCLGCIDQCHTTDDVVDIIAAAFRLIDHTTFDNYAGRLLIDAGCSSQESIRSILSL